MNYDAMDNGWQAAVNMALRQNNGPESKARADQRRVAQDYIDYVPQRVAIQKMIRGRQSRKKTRRLKNKIKNDLKILGAVVSRAENKGLKQGMQERHGAPVDLIKQMLSIPLGVAEGRKK